MKITLLSTLTVCLCFLFCSFSEISDETFFADCDQETIDLYKSDTFEGRTGEIHFPVCHATLAVPEGFEFLGEEDACHLLVDYWDNQEERVKDGLLGILIPAGSQAFYQITVAYLVSYNNCGYIKDDDANSVDYTKMLKDIQKSEKEENEKLPEEDRLSTLRWEYTPKYLNDCHVLVWAKRIGSKNGESVNYDMRVLGKDGIVSLMAVIDAEDGPEVKQKEQSIINSLVYDKGFAYSDFDSSRDRVSDWTIGGLVAGSILAKTGFFAKIGIFLLKFWKIIAVAVAGGLGAFFKKKKKDE